MEFVDVWCATGWPPQMGRARSQRGFVSVVKDPGRKPGAGTAIIFALWASATCLRQTAPRFPH